MNFYKECLGGELIFQTIGESPLSERMPERMKNCILHSTLTKGYLVLMGSDLMNESGLIHGNSVYLFLDCSSEEEIRNCYQKLSAGGRAIHPLENTIWGALFGELTDKHGYRWLLNYNKGRK
jgi:PhnB protein